MRPAFEDIYMRLAIAMSERSTCERIMSDGSAANVGCVITSTDYRYVYAVGYNGSAAGGPNGCDKHGAEAIGSCGCIHAEQNAVINCRAERSHEKIVFVTMLPCVQCAKFLVNLGGVKKVFYRRDYRIRDGLEWLKRAGIESVMFGLRRAVSDTALDLKQGEVEERLEKLERDYAQAIANLTSVQERCTELVLENRKLRGVD